MGEGLREAGVKKGTCSEREDRERKKREREGEGEVGQCQRAPW